MKTGIGPAILLAAAFGLVACSSQKSAQVKPAETVSQAAEPPPQVAKPQPQVSPLRRKVLSLLEKKQYRQALESMNGKYHEGLEKEYVLAINRLLEVGDDSYALGDYAPAAQSYKCVLNAYPVELALKKQISHEPKSIKANMESCVSRMVDQGFAEYRRGKLDSAIRKWKDVLAISPGNKEAKNALDTATIQLQSLQNLNSKQR